MRRTEENTEQPIAERRQMAEALQRRAQELEALQAIVLDIIVPHDLPTLLETIVERAARLLDARSGGLYLCEPDQEQVVCVVSYQTPRDYRGTALRYGEGAAGAVAQTGKPLIIDDYRFWSGRAAVYEEEQPFRAVLAVPMIWQGRVTGVIDVVHYAEGQLFTQNDLELLTLFANHAAIAVENTRLYDLAQEEIARRRQLEQQIEERRVYLEGVLACAPDAIVTLDAHHHVLEWNRGAEELFGYSQEEAFGRNVDDLIAVFDAGTFDEATGLTRQVLGGEPVPPTETVRYRKDGTPIDVIVAGAPIPVGDKLMGVVAVYTNITERKRTEEEIRRRAAHLEALNTVIAAATAAPSLPELLETVLDRLLQALGLEMGAIWVADEVVLRGVSPEVGVASGEAAQAASLDVSNVIVTEDWQRFGDNHAASAMARFGVRASVMVPILAEGQRVGGLSVAAPEPRSWSSEEITLVEAVGRQLGTAAERLRLLHEVRRQAQELEAAVARLQELDHLKSEFMQNVSHELRTPLALIWGYADLLTSGELGELSTEQRGPVESIVRQSQTLTALVQDITLILATEARTLKRESVSMGELVRATVADFHLPAKQAGLTLRAEIAPDLPPVSGAPVYLRRVVDNLLGNAIKFTSAGGRVTVRLQCQEDQVILQVADTGIGIPLEEQKHIFERFYQVDGTAHRRYSGAGLGLALVKEIVKAYGGAVGVESRPGEGSTFTVTLPSMKS